MSNCVVINIFKPKHHTYSSWSTGRERLWSEETHKIPGETWALAIYAERTHKNEINCLVSRESLEKLWTIEATYKQILVLEKSLWVGEDSDGKQKLFLSRVFPLSALASTHACNKLDLQLHVLGTKLFGLVWFQYVQRNVLLQRCLMHSNTRLASIFPSSSGFNERLWKYAQELTNDGRYDRFGDNNKPIYQWIGCLGNLDSTNLHCGWNVVKHSKYSPWPPGCELPRSEKTHDLPTYMYGTRTDQHAHKTLSVQAKLQALTRSGWV